MMFCKECGAQNEASQVNCASCGAALPPADSFPNMTVVQSPGQGPVPTPVERTSGAAIAALVLGILGFFTFGLAGIIGLIVGAIALRQIGRSGGRIGGKGLAIAALITAGIATLLIPVELILAAVLVPVFTQARGRAQAVSCVSNLKQIGAAIEMYEQDYDNNFPPAQSWADGLEPYLKNPTIYRCPLTPDVRSSYGYNAAINSLALDRLKTSPAEVPAVFDANTTEWNRSGGAELLALRHSGRANIAYADGHVQEIGQNSLPLLRWTPEVAPKKHKSSAH